MSELFKVLPPTTQSDVEVMACPLGYVEIVVKGRRLPTSIPAERGQQVHHVMSEYAKHCAQNRVRADWNYFDKLSAHVGHDEAGPILDGLRDHYEIPYDRFYGAEIAFALTEDFRPANKVYNSNRYTDITDTVPGVAYAEEGAAHIGKADVLYIRQDGIVAKLPDFKSHLNVFEADTYQSKLYPLFVFKHFPKVQTVIFELVFVRYRNCVRAVTYERKDIPELQAAVSRARQQQRDIRECPDDAPAFPCKTCTYCPLAADLTCPISSLNEHMVLTPVQRLVWFDWLRRMMAINKRPLKEWVEVRGPVRATSGTGAELEYGEKEVEEIKVPLDETLLKVLRDHAEATGEDLIADGKFYLKLSELRAVLKAKKRTTLREQFEDSIYMAGTKPKLKLALKTQDDGLITDDQQYREED